MIAKYTARTTWVLIILFCAYYFYRAIYYRFYHEGLGETFWNKQFWYVFHISTAIASLGLGPLQFWKWFRNKYIEWHRLLGKIYIIGSLLGGISSFYLSVTIKYPGSVIPLMLLSSLWLFTTTSAWITIKRKNIKAHRLFMIRSYVLALTFVWVRILSDLVDKHNFLSFISNSDVKDTTYEWMSWVIPLLITEFFISWWPTIKSYKK